MSYICPHDKSEIASLLTRDIPLHIYELGDLDDFFWPRTLWLASAPGAAGQAVALLYVGMELPTLLALDRAPDRMAPLLRELRPLLPARFYAHLSPGFADVLGSGYRMDPGGRHHKMVLDAAHPPAGVPSAAVDDDPQGVTVVSLGPDDRQELEAFYARAYRHSAVRG